MRSGTYTVEIWSKNGIMEHVCTAHSLREVADAMYDRGINKRFDALSIADELFANGTATGVCADDRRLLWVITRK